MASSIYRLDSTFQTLINAILAVERQPLQRLTAQRDTLSIQRSAYVDLKSQLYALQQTARTLTTTGAFSVLSAGRQVSVTAVPSTASVLTVSASSSAALGVHDVAVTTLAASQRRASSAQASATLALGKTGDFWLGGTGSSAASLTANDTLSAAGTGVVASGQRELGTGSYSVETRLADGQAQFRLRDADGDAVAIASGSTSVMTSTWQAISAGTYDTGRGLTLDFSGLAADTSTAVAYTAAGVAVSLEADDTLVDIAYRINAASQPAGREVQAAVVGTQLVLTAGRTGTAHTMIYRDDSAGPAFGFLAWDDDPLGSNLQDPRDAAFTVDGIAFVRSRNTSLTDVISGLTMSLAADAEGHSAALTVSEDLSGIRSALNTFLEQFNAAQSFLRSKTGVTAASDDGVQYQRGPLADDPSMGSLEADLFSQLLFEPEGVGTIQRLQDLGITLDDNMQLVISDSSRLDSALVDQRQESFQFLDGVMGQLDTWLNRYTDASAGSLTQSVTSFDTQISEADIEEDQLTARLSEREEYLVLQYAEMQAQIVNLSYMQQQWASIYSVYSQ